MRRPTSYCATSKVSPMLAMPSPFTSPHAGGPSVVVVLVVEVVVLVVVEVVVVTCENPWIWTMLLKTDGSPCQVETNRSLLIGSNSRPKGPDVAFDPKPEAKRVSTGLAVPKVGWWVVPSTARPVPGSIVTMCSSPSSFATYMRSPANGADGTYCIPAKLCFGRVAKRVCAAGAKKPPPEVLSDSSYRFEPYPVLI